MGRQTNGEWDVNNHRCGSTNKTILYQNWTVPINTGLSAVVHDMNTSGNKDSFFSELDFDLLIGQEMIPPPIQFNPPQYLESDTLRTKTNLEPPHGGDTEDENDFQFSDNDSLHSFSSFNVQSKPVLVNLRSLPMTHRL